MTSTTDLPPPDRLTVVELPDDTNEPSVESCGDHVTDLPIVVRLWALALLLLFLTHELRTDSHNAPVSTVVTLALSTFTGPFAVRLVPFSFLSFPSSPSVLQFKSTMDHLSTLFGGKNSNSPIFLGAPSSTDGLCVTNKRDSKRTFGIQRRGGTGWTDRLLTAPSCRSSGSCLSCVCSFVRTCVFRLFVSICSSLSSSLPLFFLLLAVASRSCVQAASHQLFPDDEKKIHIKQQFPFLVRN